MIPVEKPYKSTNGYNKLNLPLACPCCGECNLHQIEVVVFDRKEDASEGVRVKVVDENVFISKSMKGNPSHRRQATVIVFECEHGCPKQELEIIQHKGTTHLNWVDYLEDWTKS